MPTNKQILNKGIKRLSWALPLLFIGPTVIYNAFINKNNIWHYLVLAVGIGICFVAIYQLFLGLKTIVNSMSDN